MEWLERSDSAPYTKISTELTKPLSATQFFDGDGMAAGGAVVGCYHSSRMSDCAEPHPGRRITSVCGRVARTPALESSRSPVTQTLAAEQCACRPCPYANAIGQRSVCYGFNLDRPGARDRIAAVGADYDAVYRGSCLSRQQCTELLHTDVVIAARITQDHFNPVCQCVSAVVADVAFSMGAEALQQQHSFRFDIVYGRFKAAADGLARLPWCRHFAARCARNQKLIAQGCASTRPVLSECPQ